MRAILPILLLLTPLAATPATAVEAGGGGRYAFVPVKEGTLRLDTTTGAVALCAVRDGEVACRALAEQGDPQAAESLEGRIAALEARMAALEERRQSGIPDEESMQRVMTLTDSMMRHFIGLVRDLKREAERDGN
jgi:hypothetical protein